MRPFTFLPLHWTAQNQSSTKIVRGATLPHQCTGENCLPIEKPISPLPDFSDIFPFKYIVICPISEGIKADHRRMCHTDISDVFQMLQKKKKKDDSDLFSMASFHCTF